MDPECSQNSPYQNVQIVAKQLLKELNFLSSQNHSHIIIFLTKIYKNNYPPKTKKMKSIRLNQFVSLLQNILYNFPTTPTDINLLYQSVASVLANEKNFVDEEDFQLVQRISMEIAKIIEKFSEGEFGHLAVKLLSHFISGQSLSSSLMEITEFEQSLKCSKYFQEINFNNMANSFEQSATNHEHQWHILETISISEIILQHSKVQKIYSKLFKYFSDKYKVASLFYDHMKKPNQLKKCSRKELLIQCFIQSHQILSLEQAQSILKILQRQVFDRDTVNQVINKIINEKISLEQLLEIDFKKIRGIQEVLIQCLLQMVAKKNIYEIIQIFLNMKNQHNYFPLYLLLKINTKVPIQFIDLFFQQNLFFNLRKGIIFLLAIVDHGLMSLQRLLVGLAKWKNDNIQRTKQHYKCLLKAIHFSLQNLSKANVVSQILRSINQLNLNKECYLQFIHYRTLNLIAQQDLKQLLTQSNRQMLLFLLKELKEQQKQDNKRIEEQLLPQMIEVEEEHKYKLDIEQLLESNPLIQRELNSTIKQLNRLLDGKLSLQEIVKQLPSIEWNLLQVTLMWINNKYDTLYLEENVNGQIIEWALKIYKKYMNEIDVQLKTSLQKEKLPDGCFALIRTLIEFSMERQVQLKFITDTKIFTPQLKQMLNSSLQRMNSNNFNDYFLTSSKYKTYIIQQNSSHITQKKTYTKIAWLKTLLIELKRLLVNMIKADKVSNRKQLKNLIAENVADVLAFKIIHEYFLASIEQGRDLLLEVFRNIQPDTDFFQRTEALANSLNIEFYSVIDELPKLLQHFNSQTLVFVSKLITSPKSDEKKKSSRKKKQKQNTQQESPYIGIIVENFSLLFGNPNSMDTFKSLFIILKKLVDINKINRDELQRELNKWLLRISFVPCNAFQNWRGKVMSLSKMWKNAAELLGDKKIEKKFELQVLDRHFSLFTDLLNKLYENFRKESQFLQLQQRILLSLCLIYKKQDFSNKIQEQRNMIPFIIKKFEQKNMSSITLNNKFYYCNQCRKNTCYACASLFHRNHDNIFIGKAGNCQHQNNGQNLKSKKQAILKAEYGASLYEKMSGLFKKNQDIPQELLQRITKKMLFHEQLGLTQDTEILERFRDPQLMREMIEVRFSKNNLKGQNKKEDQKQAKQDQNSLSPQAEDFFQYKQPYCKEFKKINSQMITQPPKFNVIIPQINVSPLARVFLRELEHQSFYNDLSTQQKQNPSMKSLILQQLKQKVLFFKNNNFRPDTNRDYAFGRGGRGGFGGGFGYGQNPRDNSSNTYTRNTMICNKKYILVPSSLILMNLSMSKINEKLTRKFQAKEYSQVEQQQNYAFKPPNSMPFDIIQTALSGSSNNLLIAVVGINQLCFYPINADGRFGRQINSQFSRTDNITKFIWINDKKNQFAVACANYIRIGGVSSSLNTKTYSKAQIPKTIRDFDGYINSKIYILFIVDQEGKLYFVDLDFKEGRNASYSTTEKVISLQNHQGNLIKDEIYSIKNVDLNRLITSSTNGVLRVVEVDKESNVWMATSYDLKKSIKADTGVVLDAIKIIKYDEETIMFAGLGRKLTAVDNLKVRRCSGQLFLITLNTLTETITSIFYTKEQNIESYDFTFLTPGQLTIAILNDQGAINFIRKSYDLEPKQIVEKINSHIDNMSLRAFCKKLVNVDFFSKVEEGGMMKNLQFKENKIINGGFAINLKREQLSIKQTYPHSHFVTGLSFQAQLSPSIAEYGHQQQQDPYNIASIKLKVFESEYSLNCTSKLRQIQIPFNIKETLQAFAHENEFKINIKVELNQEIVHKEKFTEKQIEELLKFKNVQLHGFEVRDMVNPEVVSPYHVALKELYNDWFTYQEFIADNFEEYSLNYYRHDFHNIDIKKLYRLKHDTSNQALGFLPNQINLLLKIQLFSQSLVPSLLNDLQTSKEKIEDYIKLVKKQLLNKEYRRKSLQNSVFRVCQVLCYVYERKSKVTAGHPYQRETLINLHSFTISYRKWENKKNITTFNKLCTELSNLIFIQAIDLDLILQSFPEIMIEISIFFKQLVSQRKQKQFCEEQTETSITKICEKYIIILCQFYQVAKNKKIPKIEQKILVLLQQVFGQLKQVIPKQLIINPFYSLQTIFNTNQKTQINSIVDLYSINNNIDFINQDSLDLQKYNNLYSQKKTFNLNLKQQEVVSEFKEKLRIMENDWELMEEEKEIDEEENQMYMHMDIEEDFDYDDQMVEQDLENADNSSKKQNSSPNIVSSFQSQPATINKHIDETLTASILPHIQPQTFQLTIIHHDFPLQLAIELFRRQNYLNESNVCFFLELLFNLLKIIENNMKIRPNKRKLLELVQIVDKRIQSQDYSILFIVANFFVCPKYIKTDKGLIMKKIDSALLEGFITYYKQNKRRLAQLLIGYNPSKFSPASKLSQIMKLGSSQVKNELYNLRFLSNIYLSFRLFGNNFTSLQENIRIKQEILFKLVKFKLPVLKNIMLFEKWEKQLDRAKILVGFDIIMKKDKKEEEKEEGINMLYKCAKEQPQKFIGQLIQDPDKVSFLQEYSLESWRLKESVQSKTFELLQIYYSN